LNAAGTEAGFRVFVGVAECNITGLTEERIYCVPPSGQPHLRRDGQEREDGIPRVFVCIFCHKMCVYYRNIR
jgi:hypothetical protein